MLTRNLNWLAWVAMAFLPLLGSGCMSPGIDMRLRNMEARQDSILKVLIAMQEKNDFVAAKVGWRPPPDTTPKVIPVGNSFSHGPQNAKVTIIEFSDLECPYCAQVAPILDSVSKAFPNDVRIVFKHFPLGFHEKAREAAAAAIAAGNQGKFFEFRSASAPHFRSLSETLYDSIAQHIGLDMERFRKERVLTTEIGQILDKDMELGRKVGVEGTPTIFVNGKLATNRSFDYFAQMIGK